MKLGLIKEGKEPADKRVVLSPEQCVFIQSHYPNIKIYVQRSADRCFSDEEYAQKGIILVDSVEDCEIILGVKEVPIPMLIPNKTFFFFSHTIKKQSQNRGLLQQCIQKNIRLVDYECIVDKRSKRLIGFGKFAGIIGSYNAFLTFGKRNHVFDLKFAYECSGQEELMSILQNISLPPIKILLTGDGRVGHGVREILEAMKIPEISPEDFLRKTYSHAVFSNVLVSDYIRHSHTEEFEKKDYYQNPHLYYSILGDYVSKADLLITGHVWKKRNPILLDADFFRNPNNKCKVVADITCDLNEPIACTIRACKIGEPYFYYDPISEKETAILQENSISVMSVDNLPCELPQASSVQFGQEFIDHVLPELLNQSDIIKNATICEHGKLGSRFLYLRDFVSESRG